jgi:hypothetical protein
VRVRAGANSRCQQTVLPTQTALAAGSWHTGHWRPFDGAHRPMAAGCWLLCGLCGAVGRRAPQPATAACEMGGIHSGLCPPRSVPSVIISHVAFSWFMALTYMVHRTHTHTRTPTTTTTNAKMPLPLGTGCAAPPPPASHRPPQNRTTHPSRPPRPPRREDTNTTHSAAHETDTPPSHSLLAARLRPASTRQRAEAPPGGSKQEYMYWRAPMEDAPHLIPLAPHSLPSFPLLPIPSPLPPSSTPILPPRPRYTEGAKLCHMALQPTAASGWHAHRPWPR